MCNESSPGNAERVPGADLPRCLVIEFNNSKVIFKDEVELPIFYRGVEAGRRKIDFLVDNKIVLEIKAVSALNDTHFAQALNYLEGLNLEIGLLLNVGSKSLEVKRIINNKIKKSVQSKKSM